MVVATSGRDARVRRQHRLRVRDRRRPRRRQRSSPRSRRARAPRGSTCAPGGAEVWVVNRDANTISVIDTKPEAVVGDDSGRGVPDPREVHARTAGARSCRARSPETSPSSTPRRARRSARISMDREAVPGSETRLFSTRFGKSPVPVGILVAPDGQARVGRLDERRRRVGDRPREARGRAAGSPRARSPTGSPERSARRFPLMSRLSGVGESGPASAAGRGADVSTPSTSFAARRSPG